MAQPDTALDANRAAVAEMIADAERSSSIDRARRARATDDRVVESRVFGRLRLTDHVRFQELHPRQHTMQIPGS